MPIHLAEPDTTRLVDSPLTLVVCQVRHERNIAVADAKRALAVHDALKDAYPKIDENAVQDISVLAGPSGVQQLPGEAMRGWRLRSKDEKWTAVLMPDFYALETTLYEDWTDYSHRLDALTAAVTEFLGPTIERRLGIRYVSRLTDPEVQDPTGWIGKIDNALLGTVAHAGLGSGVLTSQGIVQLEAENDIQVLLRHALFKDAPSSSGWDYIIDQDCYREGGRHLTVGEVKGGSEAIHRVALQVFQSALHPDYFRRLKQGHDAD